MKLRKTLAALVLTAVIPVAAACGTDSSASTTASADASTSTTTTDTGAFGGGGPGGGGPGGGGVDVESVTTEAELVALVEEAYGDGALDLHRGHQPVQDVLDDVLGISHDELHVRMDAGQDLAAVATDLGIAPQTLVDALVESWSPAIDDLLASGEITEAEAEQYRDALEEAFTFRVNWDGEEATPAFSGLAA
jgi:polyhydroxyalkanoate synthesis regulator phasin